MLKQSFIKSLDGKPLGMYNTNTMLNTRKYLVRFKSGEEDEFMANAVAENIYSQCDPQGRQFQMMEDIIEWRTNADALTDNEESTFLLNGIWHPITTTKEWSFLVQWNRGEATWVPLKDLKKSNCRVCCIQETGEEAGVQMVGTKGVGKEESNCW